MPTTPNETTPSSGGVGDLVKEIGAALIAAIASAPADQKAEIAKLGGIFVGNTLVPIAKGILDEINAPNSVETATPSTPDDIQRRIDDSIALVDLTDRL